PALAEPTSGHNSLILNWSAPGDTGGAPITGYTVRWALIHSPTDYLNTGGAAGKDVGLVTTYTITGLMIFTDYYVEVAAVNAISAGAWSDRQSDQPFTAGIVCLGSAAIPDYDACLAAAEAGYVLSKNLPGAQTFIATAVRARLVNLPVTTFTLKITQDAANPIAANTDIEGELGWEDIQLIIPDRALTASAPLVVTPKASGDGGSVEVNFTYGNRFTTSRTNGVRGSDDPTLVGAIFTLAAAGIRITAANADGACPAAHNAAVTALTLAEGADATGLCVSLAAAPSANTPVSCAVGDAGLIEVLPADLTFTGANWQTAQPLSARAPDDNLAFAADATDTLTCRSRGAAGGEYADAAADVFLTVSDTDMVAATGTLTANIAGVRENAGAQTVTFTATLDAGALPGEQCFVRTIAGNGNVGSGEVKAVNEVDFTVPGVVLFVVIPAGESSGSVDYVITPIRDNDAASEVIPFVTVPEDCSGTVVDFGRVDIRIVEFVFGMLDGVAGADAADGLLVARYLAGARGMDLVAGLGLADAAAVGAIAAADIGGNLHLLDVDGVNGTTMADGIMIARYYLGVTSGEGLLDGQADSSKESTVTTNIGNLP
ncbi:MAG: fibronectin type III domain-containing protein, partial [Gammaproteobacteria bacterium]